MNGEPIAASTPIETGALSVYNWDAYIYKQVLKAVRGGVRRQGRVDHLQQHGGGHPEAGGRPGHGRRLLPDHRTTLAGSSQSDLLQPLQHELIPNLAGERVAGLLGSRPVLRPRGWRYTVPYTIYTTGVAYRRDRVERRRRPRPPGTTRSSTRRFKDAVAYYDSYRDALGDDAAPERRHGSRTPTTPPRSAPRRTRSCR